MPYAADIAWLKRELGPRIRPSLAGTPFDLDMLAALACQETGEVWPILRHGDDLNTDGILALCVGDALDEDKGRTAFPRNKAELLDADRGATMFKVARDALVAMAQRIPAYAFALKQPNKFAHGFGLFQRDIQFFRDDPDYFLSGTWAKLEGTLEHCLAELRNGLKIVGLVGQSSISDLDFCRVAIAYNTGTFKPAKGLRQGHFNGKRFYGEEIFDFLALCRTVPDVPGAEPLVAAAAPNEALLPLPTAVPAEADFVVDTREAPLRVRAAPSVGEAGSILAHLPDGHPVRAVSDRAVRGFREVETSLLGAHVAGFVGTSFLAPAPEGARIEVVAPVPKPPSSTPPAVLMPRKDGTVTRRTGEAGAHSLNEPGQPSRSGATPAELVASLGVIIDWLDVEKPSHKRYQPHDGLTFCNIYAHDYCLLAGAYLPRVWWTRRGLDALARGEAPEPLIEDTIDEMRANDLFRWLRDFGIDFGWRRTGTLDKLQQAANQGGLGLIVARRKEDGRSGHIVAVVPETETDAARRSKEGEVIAALQSQAGATNFRRRTGRLGWWTDEQFAESAFWVHG